MYTLQDSMVCGYLILIPKPPATGRKIMHYCWGKEKNKHYTGARGNIMCSKWLFPSIFKPYAKLEYSII